ncbi:reverse transcriptase domain-containing protein [Tanacetum coccineum]
MEHRYNPKKVKFEWVGDKQEAAFQLLKQKLCSAPILALPEGSEDFIVYCDASKKGLGAVLMQREKLLSDYDCDIRYHPGKANVVADALSRQTGTTDAKTLVIDKRATLDLKRNQLDVLRLEINSDVKVSPWKGVVRFGKTREIKSLVKVRLELQERSKVYMGTRRSIPEEIPTFVLKDRAVIKCCVLSLEDKAQQLGARYNTL